jgi:hypothetical protein
MLYTVGAAEDYDKLLVTDPAPMKLGRTEDYFGKGRHYLGGAAYLTYEEAVKAAREHSRRREYKPYGLMTTVENTYIAEEVGERRLLKSCLIVPVPKSKTG